MIRIACFSLLPLFLCLTTALPAGGRKEEKMQEERRAAVQEEISTLVQVSGRVRLVGSNPFPYLVVTGPELEWYIDKADEDKFMDLQHKIVTIVGYETVLELFFANGRPAGERRTLKDVKIISVD